VADLVDEPADLGRDHRSGALHGLERCHPEALAERREHDDRGVLDRGLNRDDRPKEAHRVFDVELFR